MDRSMISDSFHKILFERPNLPELREQYAVVDMHFHSHLSDGHASIEDIAQRSLELGIGIAVTDHNAIHGAVEIDRFMPSYRHTRPLPVMSPNLVASIA